MKSSYRCYDRATKAIHLFLEALQLMEKPSDETASEDSNTIRGALEATHIDNGVISCAKKQEITLRLEAADVAQQRIERRGPSSELRIDD